MERDEETGLQYHHHRYLAPWLGRWTRSDPAGIEAGVNRYRYAKNNPKTLLDPTGLQEQHPDATSEAAPATLVWLGGKEGVELSFQLVRQFALTQNASARSEPPRVRIFQTQLEMGTALAQFETPRLAAQAGSMSLDARMEYARDNPMRFAFNVVTGELLDSRQVQDGFVELYTRNELTAIGDKKSKLGGQYRPEEDAIYLAMDAKWGPGTVIHEMLHSFMSEAWKKADLSDDSTEVSEAVVELFRRAIAPTVKLTTSDGRLEFPIGSTSAYDPFVQRLERAIEMNDALNFDTLVRAYFDGDQAAIVLVQEAYEDAGK